MKKRSLLKRIRIRVVGYFLGLSLPRETSVFGSSYPTFQGALAQSQVGDRLQIVHAIRGKRKHDVFIYNIELNRLLGFVENGLNETLIHVFGKGFCLDGIFTYKEYSFDRFFGLAKILPTTEMMEPYIDDIPYLFGE